MSCIQARSTLASFPSVTVKWAIVKATFKIELDIWTQLMIEEITNCPVNASKQKKRKKEKPQN